MGRIFLVLLGLATPIFGKNLAPVDTGPIAPATGEATKSAVNSRFLFHIKPGIFFLHDSNPNEKTGGLGITGNALYRLMDDQPFYFGFTTGFNYFVGDVIGGHFISIFSNNGRVRNHLIPVLATAYYRFNESSRHRIFVSLNVGNAFLTTTQNNGSDAQTRSYFMGHVTPGYEISFGRLGFTMETSLGLVGSQFYFSPSLGLRIGF